MPPARAELTFPSGAKRKRTVEPGESTPDICAWPLASVVCREDDESSKVSFRVNPEALVYRKGKSRGERENFGGIEVTLRDGDSVEIVDKKRRGEENIEKIRLVVWHVKEK